MAEDTSSHVERALKAVLAAIAADPLLSRDYVLKGGLALRLLYGSPRISDDVDLSSAKPYSHDVTDEKNDLLLGLCLLLDGALAKVERQYGLRDMRVHEKTLSTEIPALLGSVVYRDDRSAGDDDELYEVKMQITLSELICETTRKTVDGVAIFSAVLEDILADKLKAMLQQVTRNKLRPMDVYDVWYFSSVSRHPIDLDRLREYLQIKTARWPEVFPPTTERFHEVMLRDNSKELFPSFVDRLQGDAPRVSFEDAFAGVLALVESLELPELVRPQSNPEPAARRVQ